MKLYDRAKVMRSKNAGPFMLTIDIILDNEDDFDVVVNSAEFNREKLAQLYHTEPEKVAIHPFRRVLAVKVSIPRSVSSGAPDDCDVYGSQQHFPLALLNI